MIVDHTDSSGLITAPAKTMFDMGDLVSQGNPNQFASDFRKAEKTILPEGTVKRHRDEVQQRLRQFDEPPKVLKEDPDLHDKPDQILLSSVYLTLAMIVAVIAFVGMALSKPIMRFAVKAQPIVFSRTFRQIVSIYIFWILAVIITNNFEFRNGFEYWEYGEDAAFLLFHLPFLALVGLLLWSWSRFNCMIRDFGRQKSESVENQSSFHLESSEQTLSKNIQVRGIKFFALRTTLLLLTAVTVYFSMFMIFFAVEGKGPVLPLDWPRRLYFDVMFYIAFALYSASCGFWTKLFGIVAAILVRVISEVIIFKIMGFLFNYDFISLQDIFPSSLRLVLFVPAASLVIGGYVQWLIYRRNRLNN